MRRGPFKQSVISTVIHASLMPSLEIYNSKRNSVSGTSVSTVVDWSLQFRNFALCQHFKQNIRSCRFTSNFLTMKQRGGLGGVSAGVYFHR